MTAERDRLAAELATALAEARRLRALAEAERAYRVAIVAYYEARAMNADNAVLITFMGAAKGSAAALRAAGGEP